MFEYREEVTTRIVVPHVVFTSIDGKDFGMPVERIIHYETFCTRDANGNEILDKTKTFVNFVSPNPKSKGSLHAIVDMSVDEFFREVIRPAYEGKTATA